MLIISQAASCSCSISKAAEQLELTESAVTIYFQASLDFPFELADLICDVMKSHLRSDVVVAPMRLPTNLQAYLTHYA